MLGFRVQGSGFRVQGLAKRMHRARTRHGFRVIRVGKQALGSTHAERAFSSDERMLVSSAVLCITWRGTADRDASRSRSRVPGQQVGVKVSRDLCTRLRAASDKAHARTPARAQPASAAYHRDPPRLAAAGPRRLAPPPAPRPRGGARRAHDAQTARTGSGAKSAHMISAGHAGAGSCASAALGHLTRSDRHREDQARPRRAEPPRHAPGAGAVTVTGS